MCNNCNCDVYDQCSIVGYLPIGFCCSKCYLYNESRTCLSSKTSRVAPLAETEEITPISTTIEGGLLKVVIRKNDKEVPVYIDLKKQLSSQ